MGRVNQNRAGPRPDRQPAPISSQFPDAVRDHNGVLSEASFRPTRWSGPSGMGAVGSGCRRSKAFRSAQRKTGSQLSLTACDINRLSC